MLQIGVIGSGKAINKEIYKLAYDLGKEIAKTGALLICGGLWGVMEAVSKGVKDGGGLTIGILPSMNKGDANPYIDIAIPTGLGHIRNTLVVASSDVIISISGSVGTLSEIAFSTVLEKPIIVITASGGVSAEISKLNTVKDLIFTVSSPKEAIEKAIEICKEK